jgi:glyoxylase-like metal-dependent hydrolase (beta-lactamase superfamily II)
MITDTQAYIAEMKNYAPVLPDITLDTDLVLHDKMHDLHLAFRGRGHTAGDVVVFCSQKKVVASGDLLHSFPPFLADGYPLDWSRTLLRVAEFDYAIAIGGHASIHRGKERLYQMGNFIDEMTEGVVRGKEKKTVAMLQKELTPATLKTLQGDYGRFLVESTRRYRMIAPGIDPAAVLATGVEGCIAQIYSALGRS